MAVENCKICGKIFNQTSELQVCNSCKSIDDKTFRILREYIYSNTNVNIQALSSNTKIPISTIMRYIKEGRLH